MSIKKYIPKSKGDMEAVEHLKTLPFKTVRADAAELLEWLQDMHWPVAYDIGKYLFPHVQELTKELLFILNTNDSIWEGNIIRCLIGRSPHKLDRSLIEALKRIAESPTHVEIDDEINEDAKRVLANKFLCE